VDNWVQLQRIQYILQYSLAMTLGRKFNISTPKVFKRLGKTLTYVIRDKEGKEKKKVSFYLNHDWAKNRDAFQNKKYADIDLIRSEMHMRSRSSIAKPCCICGETLDKVQIEMHHVRHIRKLSDKRQATGFNRILRRLNRKQIPVCKVCHGNIHQGKYDSVKLSDMAYLPY
jgi:nicotine oxidoreductase